MKQFMVSPGTRRDEEFRLYLLLIVVATDRTTNITPCIHRWLRPFDTGFQVSTITSTGSASPTMINGLT